MKTENKVKNTQGNMDMTQRAFIINKQLQRLLSLDDSDTNEVNSVLSMQAVVNAIVEPNSERSKQTLRDVNTSLKYVKWYQQVLASYTFMHSPAQAAASSVKNNIFSLERKGEGFTLKVTQAAQGQANANVIVSIIKVAPEQQERGVFLHCLYQDQLYVISLGVALNNQAQAIVARNNKAFSAIVTPESHLYLS